MVSMFDIAVAAVWLIVSKHLLAEPKTESIDDDFVDAGADTTPTNEAAQVDAAAPEEDSIAKASAGGKKKKGKK
jgi:hypothetical protein